MSETLRSPSDTPYGLRQKPRLNYSTGRSSAIPKPSTALRSPRVESKTSLRERLEEASLAERTEELSSISAAEPPIDRLQYIRSVRLDSSALLADDEGIGGSGSLTGLGNYFAVKSFHF